MHPTSTSLAPQTASKKDQVKKNLEKMQSFLLFPFFVTLACVYTSNSQLLYIPSQYATKTESPFNDVSTVATTTTTTKSTTTSTTTTTMTRTTQQPLPPPPVLKNKYVNYFKSIARKESDSQLEIANKLDTCYLKLIAQTEETEDLSKRHEILMNNVEIAHDNFLGCRKRMNYVHSNCTVEKEQLVKECSCCPKPSVTTTISTFSPVKRTTTDQAQLAASHAYPIPPPTRQPTMDALSAMYPREEFTEWAVPKEHDQVVFRSKGRMIGTLGFSHLILDINLNELRSQGTAVCDQVHQIYTSQWKRNSNALKHDPFSLILRDLNSDCNTMKTKLDDMFSNFVRAAEQRVTDETRSRRKKRQLIIGALLLIGIIAAVSIYFSNMSLANISVGAGTNPATIHVATNHEARLNIDEGNIDTLKRTITDVGNQLNKNTKNIEDLIKIQRLEILLRRISEKYSDIFSLLESLKRGKLSPLTFDAHKLHIIFTQLQRNALKIGYKMLLSTSADIYDCETSFLVFSNHTIRTITHIPLYKEKTLLDLYEYIPLPIKMNETFVTIHSEKKFLAINEAKDRFSELNDQDIQSCHQVHKMYYCKNYNYYVKDRKQNCLINLYLNDIYYTSKSCHFQLQTPQTYVTQLTHNIFYMYHNAKNTATLSCPAIMRKAPQQKQLEGLMQITIPNNCKVETNDLVAEATVDIFSAPHELHIVIPQLDRSEDLKNVNYIFNQKVLNHTIQPQSKYRLHDIKKMFDENEVYYQLKIGFFTFLVVVSLLVGFCCLYCCCAPVNTCVNSCCKKTCQCCKNACKTPQPSNVVTTDDFNKLQGQLNRVQKLYDNIKRRKPQQQEALEEHEELEMQNVRPQTRFRFPDQTINFADQLDKPTRAAPPPPVGVTSRRHNPLYFSKRGVRTEDK